MSNNESDLSKMSNPDFESQLEEEIDGFKKRAKDWYQALNDEHRKERIKLLEENKELKDQLADLRKKLKEADRIKPKIKPVQIHKAAEEACKKQIEKLEAENAGYKKALADNEKFQASKEEELKKQNEEFEKVKEQRNLFCAGIKMHENMTTKLKEKLFYQFEQLNHLRSQVKDPQIPESSLKEEIEAMWSQAVEETKI